MKKKKWLVGILIISLLSLAYFWDEIHLKRGEDSGESISAAQAAGDLDANKSLKTEEEIDQQNEGEKSIEEAEEPEVQANERAKAHLESQEWLPLEKEQKKEKETTERPRSAPEEVKEADSNPEGGKDQYLTDPVPEGKPKPVEWQNTVVNKEEKLTVTLSVTCKTILDNLDIFDKDKLEVLPQDGVIYPAQSVTFYEGESVFDVLLREMQNNKIHMEFVMTPIYNSNYVEGINNLYEFDCGELSGWMYKVNGWFPNYGSSRYLLQDGDVVEWIYTCDLGRDIGGWTAVGGTE